MLLSGSLFPVFSFSRRMRNADDPHKSTIACSKLVGLADSKVAEVSFVQSKNFAREIPSNPSTNVATNSNGILTIVTDLLQRITHPTCRRKFET